MTNNKTSFQLKIQERNDRIKAYYLALPTGMRSARKVAKLFGVSRQTVLNAVNGK